MFFFFFNIYRIRTFSRTREIQILSDIFKFVFIDLQWFSWLCPRPLSFVIISLVGVYNSHTDWTKANTLNSSLKSNRIRKNLGVYYLLFLQKTREHELTYIFFRTVLVAVFVTPVCTLFDVDTYSSTVIFSLDSLRFTVSFSLYHAYFYLQSLMHSIYTTFSIIWRLLKTQKKT